MPKNKKISNFDNSPKKAGKVDQTRPVNDDIKFNISQQKHTDRTQTQNGDLFKRLIKMMPIPLGVTDKKGQLSFFNDRFTQTFGYTLQDIPSLDLWWQLAYPDQQYRRRVLKTWQSAVNKAIETNTDIEPIEYNVTCKDGTVRAVIISGSIFEDNLLATFTDVTQRKKEEQQLHKLNRVLRALSSSSVAMMRSTSEQKMLQEACKIIVNDCGYTMVWIGYAEDNPEKNIRPMAHFGLEQGFLENLNVTWADTAYGQGPSGTAIRTGKVSMCRNILTDPKFDPWRTEAIKRGYASSISLPLMEDDKAFGVLTIYSKALDPFTQSEIDLLSELANDLSYGITFIRSRLNRLEAQQALHQSEIKYRSLFENMLDGSAFCKMLYDKNGKPDDFIYLDVNPAFQQLTGLKNVIQKRVTQVIPGIKNSDPQLFQIYGKVAKTGKPEKFELEFKAMNVWFSISVYCPKPDHFVAVFHDITQQKKAVDALKLSEEKYRELVENANSIILKEDNDGNITYFNEYAEKFFGYKKEEVLGKNVIGLITPKIESTGRNLENILKDIYIDPDKFSIHVNENIKRNGQRVWISWSNRSLFDQDGKRIGHIAIGIDITDRKHAEQALAESEQKYRDLAETANSIIMKVDKNLNITYMNQYGLNFFGYTNQELIGKSVIGTTVPLKDDSGSDLSEMSRNIIENPEKYKINVHQNKRKDGSLVWVSWTNKILTDEIGNFVEILAIGNDFTILKQAEDQLNRQKYYLEKAQQIGLIGTWEIEADNRITWTDQTYKIFDIPVGSQITYDLFLQLLHPDDKNYLDSQWQAAVKDQKTYDIEHRIIVDGHIKWVREKADLQFDDQGRFLKAIGFVQDITQFKNIQRQITEYTDRLKSKNEEMEHFLRVIRHDLGNPLLSVQAFSIELARVSRQLTKLIEDSASLQSKNQLQQIINDDIPSSVNYIQNAVKQMNAILEGLRQIANIGQLSVNIQSIDVNKLVSNLSETMKHRLLDADASLTIDDLPPCLADENQISQVFSNLLTNAVKYKDSNRKCQIHISGRIEQDHSIYCVEDNGIGMTPDQQEKIFEPFYRAGAVANIEGEGLGLTIVAKILERLNGSIWVESQLGIGSKFFVALPHT